MCTHECIKILACPHLSYASRESTASYPSFPVTSMVHITWSGILAFHFLAFWTRVNASKTPKPKFSLTKKFANYFAQTSRTWIALYPPDSDFFNLYKNAQEAKNCRLSLIIDRFMSNTGNLSPMESTIRPFLSMDPMEILPSNTESHDNILLNLRNFV